MARAGVTSARVIEAAAQLADRHGIEAVSLARIASELGVKSPSLYAHVEGLEDVVRELKRLALVELADRMRRATTGRSKSEALRALADAQRSFAREHPGLWAAMVKQREGDKELDGVSRDVLEVVLDVLRGYGLEGTDALHATRILRAMTRGFIDLELAGGFGLPLEIDESWRRLLDALEAMLE
jgi:AcrR family transcriptional regulator